VQKAALVETHNSQQQQQQQQQWQPHKQSAGSQSKSHQNTSHPPSASLLYTVVNKELEEQFSGRSVTL
jgi:hypothetical protein